MMKTALTSIDIYFLADELDEVLDSARVDRVYQISGKELKMRGSGELIIAPNYLCLTGYPRDVPEQPSSFAMQLRKHLKGAFITAVRQHNFDRIVEFELRRSGSSYLLIAEVFSRGNVILCNTEKRILGLLEWQHWRDRRLGVGQIYQYPPETVNPLRMDLQGFQDILKKSDKSLVSTLASDLSLGGVYSEELCLNSSIEKDRESKTLGEDEIRILFNSLQHLVKAVKKGDTEPTIILDENKKSLDVTPFHLSIYDKLEKRELTSMNEAVDNYFIESEFIEGRRTGETIIKEKLEKLRKIELGQRETIRKLEEKSGDYRKIGDLIYQNIQSIEGIMKSISDDRKKGVGWSEIRERFTGRRFNGVKVEGIEENGGVTLEVDVR
jgi:predicted ribosome quality control (RQC) complex YloA/Tae2 family protein